jgi:hypothetical protein
LWQFSHDCEDTKMKTSASALAVSENQKATAPIELTESETDHIAGGAPNGDPGNAYGAGRGLGIDGHGGGKGQGWFRNNDNGRF